MKAAAVVFAVLFPVAAAAQQSAHHRLAESVFNSGGRPEGGSVAGSAHHRITLDALGDAVTPGFVSGGAFVLGGGFVTAYPPPREVTSLRFNDHVSLSWSPEPSIGTYSLYRGAVTSLPGLSYGTCRASAIAGPATTDADVAPPGQGYFYLVTARNMIAEEGIKGRGSSGALRANPAPCP